MAAVTFDPFISPLARSGSFWTITGRRQDGTRGDALYIRYVAGAASPPEVFRIDCLVEGKPIAYGATATPSTVALTANMPGQVSVCLEGAASVRVRVEGPVVLRLVYVQRGWHDSVVERGNGAARLNLSSSRIQIHARATTGHLAVLGEWKIQRTDNAALELTPADGVAELVLDAYRVAPPPPSSATFDEVVACTERELANFVDKLPAVPEPYELARQHAGYVLWSAVAPTGGALSRRAIYMSKHGMNRLWSWDSCFNAVALWQGHRDLAWEQIQLLVDHQDESGAFFDCIDDRDVFYNFTKPPIQGWALSRMNAASALTKNELTAIYEPMQRWSRFWLNQKDTDDDGVPEYDHGNDSGWDNASIFDDGVPVSSPDLMAYLVLHFEFLQTCAARLNRKSDLASFTAARDRAIRCLTERLIVDGQFCARLARTGAPVSATESLITRMPVVLGERLPRQLRDSLAAQFGSGSGFVTEVGLASEAVTSSRYESDGYWRGPTWPPIVVLVFDGLVHMGRRDLALDIARRYCDNCTRHGFFENYDSISGRGLREPAYTWAASAFLLLAPELASAR